MIEYCRGVVGEHLHRIFDRRLARLSHSTIVESDHGVIRRKLRHLVEFPNFAVARCFAEKEKRWPAPMDLIVDVCVLELQDRHDKPPLSKRRTTLSSQRTR